MQQPSNNEIMNLIRKDFLKTEYNPFPLSYIRQEHFISDGSIKTIETNIFIKKRFFKKKNYDELNYMSSLSFVPRIVDTEGTYANNDHYEGFIILPCASSDYTSEDLFWDNRIPNTINGTYTPEFFLIGDNNQDFIKILIEHDYCEFYFSGLFINKHRDLNENNILNANYLFFKSFSFETNRSFSSI